MAISDWSKRPNLTNRQSLFANRRRFGRSPVRGEFFVHGSYSSGLAPLLPVSPTGLSDICLRQHLRRTPWLVEFGFADQQGNQDCPMHPKLLLPEVSSRATAYLIHFVTCRPTGILRATTFLKQFLNLCVKVFRFSAFLSRASL